MKGRNRVRHFVIRIFRCRLLGCLLIALVVLNFSNGTANARNKAPGRAVTFPLHSAEGLEVKSFPEDSSVDLDTKVEAVTYRGRRALRMLLDADGQAIAVVKKAHFKDGTIEADIAATPRQGAPADARGFVGISFRVQDNGQRFETIYLRMTNGRADDQLRRNHSVQYTSEPDFPWHRLRKESPGIYESYVDLDPGAWTKVRIVVRGVKTAVYVNGAEQPCLIVNDLKLGESGGQVALYVASDTDAYYSNLRIMPTQDGD